MPEPGGAETTRERILSAAVDLTAEGGWSSLTMGGLAKRAGVSRQTVYNEFGNRDQLGEAMVLTELAVFWRRVEAAFDAHPTDLVAAIRQAVYDVLVAAPEQPVLQAIIGASQGSDAGLLPLLTTNASEMIDVAKAAIRTRTPDYPLAMDQRERDAALDTVVRLMFSHLTSPAPDPARAADDIAWVASRMLTFG